LRLLFSSSILCYNIAHNNRLFLRGSQVTDEVVELLRPVSLFANLKTRDLRRIANLFEQVAYDREENLTRQGEVGDRFYLVQSGRATVWHVDSNGTEQAVRELQRGDHFGITALLLDEPRDATVRVAENSTMLSLERSLFSAFLEDFPAVRDALVVPKPIRERLEAPRFKWMTEDEVAIFFANKTRWVLFAAELLPATLFLGMMVLATVARNWRFVSTALAFLAVIIWGVWTLVRWQDWRNDYYVVTNKRIVHHESRLPTLQVTVDQALLHQIQNVTLHTPTPVARLLNFGTLDIQTAGRRGVISFSQLGEPARCQGIIFDQLERQRSLTRVGERAAIRDALSYQVHPQDEDENATEPEDLREDSSTNLTTFGEAVWDLGEEVPPASEPSRTHRASPRVVERFRSFLPHFREEKGDVIIWYKHPLVLIKAILIPALIVTGTFLIGILGAVYGWDSFTSLVLILFVIWCLSLGWLFWRYEDWRNDIFQMTHSHIMDIDRLPLGFRERRRQAALEQIQNINVDIPNVWARLFNYGNVVIETAGPAGDLTFEWVMRPRSVQAEVFQRLDAIRAKQRADEREQRRAELAEWFAVYHQMKDRGEI
jgi:uncharacterized membrane protein YdbT with pleckstrin-like domain